MECCGNVPSMHQLACPLFPWSWPLMEGGLLRNHQLLKTHTNTHTHTNIKNEEVKNHLTVSLIMLTFKKYICFLFYVYECSSACKYVYISHLVPIEARKGIRFSGTGVTGICVMTYG